jgi:hypothetical protein
MTNKTSHMVRIATQKRIYPGEHLSYLLIGWLNQVQEKNRTLVATLIDLTKELVRSNRRSDFPHASINPRKPGLIGSKVQFANWRRASKLMRQVNGLLSTQKMFPRLSGSSGSSLKVSWKGGFNKHTLNLGILAGGNYDEVVFGEGDAIASVLRLVELGYVARLRKCQCGHWFYARFTPQKFCGMPCQQQHFRKTDEFRAYRRRYMRKHRVILAKLEKQQFATRRRKRSGEP